MYALEIRQIELGRPTKNSRFSCRSFSYALLSVRAIQESHYNQTLKSTNINIMVSIFVSIQRFLNQ